MADFLMGTFPPASNKKTEDVACIKGKYFPLNQLFEEGVITDVTGIVTNIEALPVKKGSPAMTKLVLRNGEDVTVVRVSKSLEACSELYDRAHNIQDHRSLLCVLGL